MSGVNALLNQPTAPAPSPAPGGGGGGAATPPPAPPVPPAASVPDPTPPPTPASTDWLNGLSDEDKAFIHNKGFDGVGKVLRSYREVEKLIGKKENVVVIPDPSDPDFAEKVASIQSRLGRPEKADDYSLKIHGADPNTEEGQAEAKYFQEKFHGAGLTRDQAALVAESLSELRKSNGEKIQAKSEEARKSEINKLKSEWGVDYDKNASLGQRAVAAYGLSKETIDGIEDGIGTFATMNLLRAMGEKTREGQFVASGSGKGEYYTKEMAAAEMKDLQNDKIFFDKLMKGDTESKAKWQRLKNVVHGNVSI